MELCFPSSFRSLGAYLKRLDGVVAVDSGPLHLARSLGVPSLGILSGGDSVRWFSPLAEGDMLLRRGIFNRFPTAYEMLRTYQKWSPKGASGTPGHVGANGVAPMVKYFIAFQVSALTLRLTLSLTLIVKRGRYADTSRLLRKDHSRRDAGVHVRDARHPLFYLHRR